MIEILTATVMFIGAFFMLVASVGLIRLPDVYSRMHAATKATTLGLGGILLSTILSFQTLDVTTQALLAIFFLFITAPVAAHLISRSAYHRGPHLFDETTLDEYKSHIEKIRKLEDNQDKKVEKK